MGKHHLKQLMQSVERLEERGLVGKGAYEKIQKLRKSLELAIATKDTKRIRELIEKISEILCIELER